MTHDPVHYPSHYNSHPSGIDDERTSESNIGIAGFGMKVEPARHNPYRTNQMEGDE